MITICRHFTFGIGNQEIKNKLISCSYISSPHQPFHGNIESLGTVGVMD